MGYPHVKTEMRGLTSRRGRRADIKQASDRIRREADKRACTEHEPVTGADGVAKLPAMDDAGLRAPIITNG